MLKSNIAVWRCIPQHFNEFELRRMGYHRKNKIKQLDRLDIIQKIHIDIPLFINEGASIKYGQYMTSWTEAEGEYFEDFELSTEYALKIGEIYEDDIIG